MKNLSHTCSRLALAAGAAALSVLPQCASAQVPNGYTRPGAVAAQGQQATQAQPSEQMRPGPIVRGAFPVYRRAPIEGPVGSSGPVYSNRPGYGQGGNNDGSNGGYYSGHGPVVILREAPSYPSYGGSSYSGSYGQPYLPPVGPGNGYFHNPIPPVGPANGYFTNPIPPVGPANGYFSGQAPITGGDPPRLGGYYYGNYCDTPRHSFPSLYSYYDGFPQYIDSPNVVVIGTPYTPDYATSYLPFYTPVYQTVYNQINYYVATEGRVADLEAGGERAKAALEHAYPANSFQAAFADIAHAWTDGDIDLVRRHLRDPDTRISVFLNGKYSYSIASSDFSQITRDALDRLQTVSFDFTHLRKARNGDVTAYGAHVYRGAETGSGGDDQTVPFDQNGSFDDQSGASDLGAAKTVYVSYTLRRFSGEWDIVATDSADHDLAPTSDK